MPSIRAYMTILRVHSHRQDWSSSLAVIRDMQSRQAPIDSLVLNIVLATGVAAGELQSTQDLLQEFSKNNGADVISFNTVMKGFAQRKDVENAMKLLEDMCQTGVRPNVITFNTVMDAAVRSSRVADAWCVLSQMRDAGLAPDKFTCTTLMKGIQMGGATAEQLMMILDLLKNVTANCDSTLCGVLFRNVIEATAQLKDPALSARAIQQMREQHVMLPSQDYQRLLQKLVRKEDTRKSSTACRQTAYATMRSGRACVA
jgi:pentatricopeptide repeat protein